MRRTCLLLLAAVLAFALSGCGKSPAAAPGQPAGTETPADSPSAGQPGPSEESAGPSESAAPSPDDTPESRLKQSALDIVDILRERDLERLAGVIDPQEGLLFSPYSYIDVKTAKKFKSTGLPSFQDTAVLNWGSYDGSGEPIDLTFRDYFEKFVYDQDFASAPDISVNKILGQGNTVFNVQEIWPDASYVEFHFPGFDEKNDGMDWKSLVLVMRPSGGEWKLCAIVHGQWTI